MMNIESIIESVDEIWKDGVYKPVISRNNRVLATVYLDRNQDSYSSNDPDERPCVCHILTIMTRSTKVCEAVIDQYSVDADYDWRTDDRGLHQVSFFYDARTCVNDYEYEVCA